jgi:GAF domain-containing protein
MEAALPPEELTRVAALKDYKILDTEPERAFNEIVYLASHICSTPISLVSLIDERRQWFKAKIGMDANETPREFAFCAHSILKHGPTVVEDAQQDARFSDNPLVTGDPHIRFYAGAPLVTPSGHPLGTLCVIDREPRHLSPDHLRALGALSRLVVEQLELRRVSAHLAEALENVKTLGRLIPICSYCKSIRNDQGYYEQLESYLNAKNGLKFSHGICLDCMGLHFPASFMDEAEPKRPGQP